MSGKGRRVGDDDYSGESSTLRSEPRATRRNRARAGAYWEIAGGLRRDRPSVTQGALCNDSGTAGWHHADWTSLRRIDAIAHRRRLRAEFRLAQDWLNRS